MKINLKKLHQAALSSLNSPGESQEMPKNHAKKGPKLYLFRHTQTHDNIRKIFSGKRQTQLTKLGHQQAKQIADRLKHDTFHLIVSPPLTRCIQTINYIKEHHPRIEHRKHIQLLERDYGDLTGKSKSKVMLENPDMAVLWRRSWDVAPPGGETLQNTWELRIRPFIKILDQEMRMKKVNVIWCGTNNTVRLVRMHYENLTIEETLLLENPHGDYAIY